MRQAERLLGLRVNRDLRIQFARQALTSYAGRELFGGYLRRVGLNPRLQRSLAVSSSPVTTGRLHWLARYSPCCSWAACGCAMSPSCAMIHWCDARPSCAACPMNER